MDQASPFAPRSGRESASSHPSAPFSGAPEAGPYMSALFSLFLALWTIVGGHVTLHQLSGEVHFVDLYGTQRTADSATGCNAGQPEIWMAPNLPMATFVHELAHAYDCMDDGVMNDSPSLRPAVRPA
jgi:hypothetical protein